MQVFITEYASPTNFISSYVGEIVNCEQFDLSDIFGIMSCLFRLLSEKDDFSVVFEDDEE